MEHGQSDAHQKRLRRSHEIFASEAVDYFQQYYQFKRNEDKNYSYMTKATGDAITTISYLFRNETWKMCKDLRDFIVRDENFVNYCKVVKVDGGDRFFYNYLRRMSIILEMASFCFLKGHDFFSIASKYIGLYENGDLQLFEDKGGWAKLYKVAAFIGSCGGRLNMVMLKEEPTRKPERFVKTVGRLSPLYMTNDSNYCECFPYIIEIKWKLIIDATAGSPRAPESSSSSDGEDQYPLDVRVQSIPPLSSIDLESIRRSASEYAEQRLRPSTSREAVTSSKEVKDSGIQIEEDEKAILDYLLKCCSKRKKFSHLGESNDSEASNAYSASTESEAENVRDYAVISSSDSEESPQIQLVNLKERRKRFSEDSVSVQLGAGASQSLSTLADVGQHCSAEKIPRLSSEPHHLMAVEDTDTSPDELGTTSDEKSEQSPE